MRKRWIAVEAVLCSVPCMVLANGGLPILLFSAFRIWGSNQREAAGMFLFVAGLTLALYQYAVLSMKTIAQERYRFGWAFGLAALCTLGGLGWFAVSFGWIAAACVLGPMLAATLHFIVLQLTRRKHPAPMVL